MGRTRKTIIQIYHWLLVRRWWVLGLIALSILAFEVYEDQQPASFVYHILESVVYLAFLAICGFLIDLLLRSLRRQDQAMKILNYQHQIDLEIMRNDDWEAASRQLVKILSSTAAIDEAGLFILDSVTGHYWISAHWIDERKLAPVLMMQESCETCQVQNREAEYLSSYCPPGPFNSAALPGGSEYCLSIPYANHPMAVYRFILRPGENLTEDQKSVFENLREVIAIAIKAAQDRKSLFEMRMAETSLSERRKVSQHLHDNLGQNLAFLNMKLEQLIDEKDQLTPEILYGDLSQMRDVASDANKMVRSILQSIRPETVPVLTNVLREFASKVAQRANLEVNFDVSGLQTNISPEASQAMFFVFQEILTNVEKHSGSSKLLVRVEWCSNTLEVTVSDNGRGFDPAMVDNSGHFGLEIMQERVARVNGKIDLISSAHTGTTISVSVPLLPAETNLVKAY